MTGLVIGKFYPPHRGHHYLIRTARAQVDHLVVMMCVHEHQTIPGDLREAWLREVHPDCEIRVVPDTLPEDPHAWAKFTVEELGYAPDVVFSSESYGEPFAAAMGARHIMVDRDRQFVPISGTKIRAHPLACRSYVEPCVWAYYVRRVVLIGAESTGKTTLASQLAESLSTDWVPEYGREYWEQRLAGMNWGEAEPWTTEEFVHIAEEQQRRENLAARSANEILICDTNAFATGIWHERYRGFRAPEVDAIGAKDRVALYLLTVPDFPFVQDGWRDGEGIRDWMHERFLDATNDRPRVLLAGPQEQRLTAALEAITKLR